MALKMQELPEKAVNAEQPEQYIGAGVFVASNRGGRRNSGLRSSSCVSESQATELLEAASYAAAEGMPFNRFTTIHWDAASVKAPLAATSDLLKALSEAVRRMGGQFAYVWVRETGPSKGEHVHIVWHGPVVFPSLREVISRSVIASGGNRVRGVRKTLTIGRSLAAASSVSAHYRLNRDEVMDYCLKGTVTESLERAGVRRIEPGGVVVGKRCGRSNNIGRASRLAAG